MSKQEDMAVEETTIEFPVMPGADAPDAEEEVIPEVAEAEVAEAEVAEEEPAEEEEPADEDEVDDEPLEEAAELEEPPKAPKKTMVPKARLDEVLAKQKALQKQLDDLNAANVKPENAPEEYDFDAKEVEYQNMVLDGETDKAVGLRREIRKAERATLEYEMRQEMTQTVTQDRQMNALQQAANAMEESYPIFDRNSDDFNEDYTNEVVELRDAFMVQGYEAVDALSKAVNFVVKDHDLNDDVREAPSLAGKAKSVDEVAKKRAQVNKKLKAAEAQPPELPGESSSTHGEKGVDLSTMTEEEFAALPEATLKRLRGDIL